MRYLRITIAALFGILSTIELNAQETVQEQQDMIENQNLMIENQNLLIKQLQKEVEAVKRYK